MEFQDKKGTEGSKEVQGLHFPHLALAFPVACYRLVTNFQETNRQQETHARSVNLRLSRNLFPPRYLGYSFQEDKFQEDKILLETS